jgi:HAD superfamily hydrolase (TIGR01490 family)
MPLCIFDLDNTLLTSDSDFLWGQFLVDQQIVDRAEYEEKNRQFFEDYEKGRLDIDRYLRFALAPLTRFDTRRLYAWREQFIDTIIRPVIAPGSAGLLQQHRERGDTLMIISATNLFITAPIAELLGVPHILATEPEMRDGRYTGNYVGQPTFREGKVKALDIWLGDNAMDLVGSSFYSDSLNDLPLLEKVDHPVAVNPDDTLRETARERGWPILDLRNTESIRPWVA